jgi:Tfp pilus assembly protein PilX
MNIASDRQVKGRRRTDKGAVLVVVLIVMVALLGLGMTGLFLTSGTIQMNTNINLRNQALVVAEAGIERARSVLNSPNGLPSISALLAGATTSADEIPHDTTRCMGEDRGAILVDKITTNCSGSPTPANCTLQDIPYPSVDRSGDLPTSAGAVARTTMGSYTVYIRQDLADCRMGNFVCDQSPVPPDIDAGAATAIGGPLLCDPPENAPMPNGAVVVRSEGVASDNRTRVVLEVTMTPSLGTQRARNTPMSALCAAGASGCDDNTSVQGGIVVNSTAPQEPPSYGGASGGGAGGAGGAGGMGGAGGAGGASSTVPGTSVGGSSGSSGGSATGGTQGTGGSGTGGSTGCDTSRCPNVAVMGVEGIWSSDTSTSTPGTDKFRKWLSTHTNGCYPQVISLDSTTITTDILKRYNVIILLDLYHTSQERITCVKDLANCRANQYGAYRTGHQRQLSENEFNAFRTWVEGNVPGQIAHGHGFSATVGFHWDAPETYNINGILKRFNLKYSTNGSGNIITAFLGPNGVGVDLTVGSSIIAYPSSTILPPPLVGVSKLHISSGTPIAEITPHVYTASPYLYARGVDPDNGQTHNIGYYVDNIGSGSTKGRINVWTDEWITYDDVWTGQAQSKGWTYQTEQYWENVVQWIGQCN